MRLKYLATLFQHEAVVEQHLQHGVEQVDLVERLGKVLIEAHFQESVLPAGLALHVELDDGYAFLDG